MRFRIDAFVLPPDAGIDSPNAYAALAKRAAKIGASSGTSSNWFEQRCSEFREFVGTNKRIETFAIQKKGCSGRSSPVEDRCKVAGVDPPFTRVVKTPVSLGRRIPIVTPVGITRCLFSFL